MRYVVSLFLIIWYSNTFAQHIQYRDKKKPVATKIDSTPVVKNIAIPEKHLMPSDTGHAFKSKSAISMNKRPKKPYVEEQNMCNLLSRPDVAPSLPLIINKVSPEMIKDLKQRYAGRLYSITGLNMIDDRLKYKLKICDKDNGKFRSEYLDKDGKVINDPDLDYE